MTLASIIVDCARSSATTCLQSRRRDRKHRNGKRRTRRRRKGTVETEEPSGHDGCSPRSCRFFQPRCVSPSCSGSAFSRRHRIWAFSCGVVYCPAERNCTVYARTVAPVNPTLSRLTHYIPPIAKSIWASMMLSCVTLYDGCCCCCCCRWRLFRRCIA